MKSLLFLIPFTFFPLSLFAADLVGKVIGITDGDTISVLVDRHPKTVRLNGIDAPEKAQPFGSKAKEMLSDLAFGREVTLQSVKSGIYGRIIADVLSPDGTSVNKEMVRSGYAWWYRDYAKGDVELEKLENEAREKKKGLWVDHNPIPPWKWRKGDFTGLDSKEVATGPIVGNRNSKIYHHPGCPSYMRVGPKNRV